MDYKKLPTRCGVENCKTKLFYLEDGLLFCKYGHRREGDVELGMEDDFGPKGTRVRTAEKEKEEVDKPWTGKKAYELFMQCYQLVIRKQVQCLVEEKGLPPELEVVVKDLWALRLEKVLTRVLHHSQGSQSEGESTQTTESGYSTARSTLSASESSAVEESGVEGSVSTVVGYRRKDKKRLKHRHRGIYEFIALIETVGICYLGCLMLRAPVSLGDFHRWIEDQSLVYYKALNVIPNDMKKKLRGSMYLVQLNPMKQPLGTQKVTGEKLHRLVYTLAAQYYTSFNIKFPPLNTTALSLRFMLQLGAPPESLQAVRCLTTLLEQTYEFDLNTSYRVDFKFRWPEPRLMAIVIIAIKLAYGLDDYARVPTYQHEVAAMKLDRERYQDFLEDAIEAVGKQGEMQRILNLTEPDVFDMKPEDMDKYMDWYEKYWLQGALPSDMPPQILDLFPVEGNSVNQDGQRGGSEGREGNPEDNSGQREVTEEERGEEQLHREKTATSAEEDIFWKLGRLHRGPTLLKSKEKLKKREKRLRPGEHYGVYNIQTRPPEIELLYKLGAKVIGVEEKDLSRVLRSLEYKLGNLKAGLRNGKQRADMNQLEPDSQP